MFLSLKIRRLAIVLLIASFVFSPEVSGAVTYSDGRRIKLAFLGAEYAKGNPSPATLRMSFI